MANATILLVEDNPDEEALTLRTLKKNNIGNKIFIARDGAEARDFLFAPAPALAATHTKRLSLSCRTLKYRRWMGLKCCAASAPT